MRGVLLTPAHRWECPNCTEVAVTREARPHTPFHLCRGLHGLTAPFVAAGTKAKVETVERGDYVGREQIQTDSGGRPVMAIVTTTDTGQDCAVLAPTATASGRED